MRPSRGPLALALATLALAAGSLPASAQGELAAKDPRNLTWIEKGQLAIGGGGLNEDDVRWLHEAGFRAIVDLRAEHQDPAELIGELGMSFLDLPIESASHINATQLGDFVAWANTEIAAGRPVYLHCTNGWHRAPAFAIAWELARDPTATTDKMGRELSRERPGTVMRSLAGLLDYEATIRGMPPLAVTLEAPFEHPGTGSSMPVEVRVVANGLPAQGVDVRVWSEESDIDLKGTTDANGTYAFTYTAPAAFMDHLYARANLTGFADGADNVDFILGLGKDTRTPIEVNATREGNAVLASVHAKGRPTSTRFVAIGAGWSAVEASADGRVAFLDAPEGPIIVRAVSWGAPPVETRVAAVAPPVETPPPPTPTPTPEPPIETPPTPTPITPTSNPPTQAAPDGSNEDPGASFATTLLAQAALVAAGVAAFSLGIVAGWRYRQRRG